MLKNTRIEDLYAWQMKCLFVTVLLFPFTLRVFDESFLSVTSLHGQLSTIPILVGLSLALVTGVRENTIKQFFLPAFLFFICYICLLVGISLHSIVEYLHSGPFDASIFGETQRIQKLKCIFLSIGISNDSFLYSALVFSRDMLRGVKEILYMFGFSLWIAFLYRKQKETVFKVVRKAIVWDVVILTPYVILELLHCYGVSSVDSILAFINGLLYEPGKAPTWHPRLVFPNQLRGTWHEPGYFALWLAFATPFLVTIFGKESMGRTKAVLRFFLFFSLLWSVWFLTYARAAIALMIVFFASYLIFLLFFHEKEDIKRFCVLTLACLFAFAFVSTSGPQEIQNKRKTYIQRTVLKKGATKFDATKQVKRKDSNVSTLSVNPPSVLMERTVKSTFDENSRSNPTRLQDFMFRLEVFKKHPIAGAGDTFASLAYLKELDCTNKKLTWEIKYKRDNTKKNGLFKSNLNDKVYSVPGLLAFRGLLGFSAMYGIIFVFGVLLLIRIFKADSETRRNMVAVFTSCAGLVLSSLTYGTLSFLFVWAGFGIAIGMVLSHTGMKSSSFSTKTLLLSK